MKRFLIVILVCILALLTVSACRSANEPPRVLARPCGDPAGAPDREIEVRVQNGRVTIDPRDEFVIVDRNTKVFWNLVERDQDDLTIDFEDRALTAPRDPAAGNKKKMRRGNGVVPCRAYKYTIEVRGAQELDPIIIVRD